MFHPARLIIPDSHNILIQFCFDVLILVCLFCLVCIAKFYVPLTVHLGIILYNDQLDAQLCVKLVVIQNYTEMHGQRNIKFCNAKQAKQTYQYKNIKTKLYKNIAAIWYNEACRMKQLTPNYIKELFVKLVIK